MGEGSNFKSESDERNVRRRLKSLFLFYSYFKGNKKAGLIPAFIFLFDFFFRIFLSLQSKVNNEYCQSYGCYFS